MIKALVEQIEARHAEAEAQMADPQVIGDRQRYAEAGRLYNQLAPAAKLAEEWRRAQDDAAGAQELIAEGGDDPELREMLETARARIAELEEEIRLAMVERDPSDDKNVIVEIRVEICSNCHPFYTGKQKLVDTGGRVERFKRRAAKRAR